MALDMIQNPKGDTLKIIDQAKYKISTFLLNDDKAQLLSEEHLQLDNVGPLQEIYLHRDSILLFNTLEGSIMAYSCGSNRIVSEFKLPQMKSLTIEQQRKINDFHFGYYGGKICMGFRNMNLMLYGSVDDKNQIKIESEDQYQAQAKQFSSDEKDMMYYSYVSMGKNYTMGQFLGYKFTFMSKLKGSVMDLDLKSFIEVYSVQMKPMLYLIPAEEFIRCKINPFDNDIYAWNPKDEEPCLMFYQLR